MILDVAPTRKGSEILLSEAKPVWNEFAVFILKRVLGYIKARPQIKAVERVICLYKRRIKRQLMSDESFLNAGKDCFNLRSSRDDIYKSNDSAAANTALYISNYLCQAIACDYDVYGFAAIEWAINIEAVILNPKGLYAAVRLRVQNQVEAEFDKVIKELKERNKYDNV